MIAYIKGIVTHRLLDAVYINVHDVGYRVYVPSSVQSQLQVGEENCLFTYTNVREDAIQLYGFLTMEDYELFLLLISVSGVGASTARVMLSSLSPAQLRSAIINNEVRTIQSAKGIGAKTAQRIILDLREKVLKLSEDPTLPTLPQGQPYKEEALAALEVLGYPRKTAEGVVGKILSKSTEELSVEQLIKQALKQL